MPCSLHLPFLAHSPGRPLLDPPSLSQTVTSSRSLRRQFGVFLLITQITRLVAIPRIFSL